MSKKSFYEVCIHYFEHAVDEPELEKSEALRGLWTETIRQLQVIVGSEESDVDVLVVDAFDRGHISKGDCEKLQSLFRLKAAEDRFRMRRSK